MTGRNNIFKIIMNVLYAHFPLLLNAKARNAASNLFVKITILNAL